MTMLEKAAEALRIQGEVDYLRLPERIAMVRAVLTAIREPDEEMLKAADSESYAIPGEGDAHADVWRWMIDAILAGKGV